MSRKGTLTWLDRSNARILTGLDPQIQKKAEAQMADISAHDKWLDARKNLYAGYVLEQFVQDPVRAGVSLEKDPLRRWLVKPAFRSYIETWLTNQMDSFRICGMVSCAMATLVVYFLGAVWNETYVINFSIDALVGTAAAIILFVQSRMKYGLVKQYEKKELYRFAALDGLSLLMAILLRLWDPLHMDLSLFLFVICFFVEKKLFGDMQKELKETLQSTPQKKTGE